MTPNNNKVDRSRWRAWLGAALLVLLQVQLASHLDAEHSTATDSVESCEICLQLDANGSAPHTSSPELALLRASTITAPAATDILLGRDDLIRSARAPPLG